MKSLKSFLSILFLINCLLFPGACLADSIQLTPEFQQSSRLFVEGNFDGAVNALQPLLTIPKYVAMAKIEVGKIRKKQAENEYSVSLGHFSESANSFFDGYKAGEDKSGQDPKALFDLGTIYEERLMEFAKAAEVYQWIIRDHPAFLAVDKALYHNALCQEKLGKLEEASKAYQEIVVKHPYSSYFTISQAKMKVLAPGTGQAKAAIEAQEGLVENAKTDAQSAKASMDLAAMHVKQGDFKQAIAEYRKVANDAPNPDMAKEAYQKMAALMDEKEKDYKGAVSVLEEMVSKFPNDAGNEQNLMKLGKIYENNLEDLKTRVRENGVMYKKDNSSAIKAIDYYNQVTESGADADITAEAYLRKGELFETRIKDVDEAKRQYNEFLKRFPDHQDAEKIREKLKKLDEY